MINERTLRRTLIGIALVALAAGLIVTLRGDHGLARWIWAAGAVPVVTTHAIAIIRDVLAGRMGVDALGQTLAGVIVAIMYAGGNILEDLAVGRAERDLRSLVDRAPRVAHRRIERSVDDVPIQQVSIGDALLVRAGEVVPVDGLITSPSASLDESAVTGEPIRVARRAGEAARSGAINAGETFEMQASATAGESTYAGIIRTVTEAQTAKAPFIRMADHYALLLLPITLLVAGAAWAFSHDPVRGLAVLVAATPCPLILAAPVAFIAGAAQAARRGIFIESLEVLARTYTVFDKTGTLSVGGARLVAVESAPGEDPDEALRLAASHAWHRHAEHHRGNVAFRGGHGSGGAWLAHSRRSPLTRGNRRRSVISAANPDLLLEPGMAVVIRIVVERRDDALRAPSQALRYSPGGLEANPRTTLADGSSRLWVLRDGKLTAITVQLGLNDGNYTEIVKGDVQSGDELIISEGGGVRRR